MIEPSSKRINDISEVAPPDSNFIEALNASGPRAIDTFLMPKIRWLKDQYRQVGNPLLIYLAGSSYIYCLSPLSITRYSFQYARLQTLLGEMLIAQGESPETLHTAIQHIEMALEILDRIGTISEETLRVQVSCALFLGVAKKALGQYDESLYIMGKLSKTFIKISFATEIDLITVRRQEVIMHQDLSEHRQLAEEAVRYRTIQPYEYYRSLKRVFEYLMNHGGELEADRIYPEFRRAFAAVSHILDPIEHVSFAKNIGQFFMLRGRPQEATAVLAQSLTTARSLNLQGQVRQLEILTKELHSGVGRGELVTFKV